MFRALFRRERVSQVSFNAYTLTVTSEAKMLAVQQQDTPER
jgi:hypothetical protein